MGASVVTSRCDASPSFMRGCARARAIERAGDGRRRRDGRSTRARARVTRAERENTRDGSEDDAPDARAASTEKKPLPGSGVNLYDPVATMSRMLTRRFGIVGGLGLVAALGAVEGGEIIKALLERDVEASGETFDVESRTGVVGISASDSRIGGGKSASRGDFVGVNLVFTDAESGTEYLNTKKSGRPVAFTFEKGKLIPPICQAVEDGVRTMKRGGVRRVYAPSEAAFGERGIVLADGTRIPGNRDLLIDVTLEEVSPGYV